MPEHPAVGDLAEKNGTGRTAAETDERWRTTKAAALTIIAAEAEARLQKSAMLRSLRLSRRSQATASAAHHGARRSTHPDGG